MCKYGICTTLAMRTTNLVVEIVGDISSNQHPHTVCPVFPLIWKSELLCLILKQIGVKPYKRPLWEMLKCSAMDYHALLEYSTNYMVFQTAYPGMDHGGSSSSRGPQTSLSLVMNGKSDHIWFIGGISEWKRSEREPHGTWNRWDLSRFITYWCVYGCLINTDFLYSSTS